jgi:flagellar basal-body rod protein FlgC
MALSDVMDIAASGMTANRFWLERIANNLANANSTRSAEGGPYRREVPVFAEMLANELGANGRGVEAVGIQKDTSPFPLVYNPGHPDADSRGFLRMPNVNVVNEMVDMIAASRTFEANITVSNAAKNMMNKAMEIGK